jgi:hypothetical protein
METGPGEKSAITGGKIAVGLDLELDLDPSSDG